MIAENIRHFREEKGISQAGLAEGLNVTRQAVSNWECGKTEPDIETLHKISDILGITIEELIYGLKREAAVIHNHNTTQNITKKITNGVSFGCGSCNGRILREMAIDRVGDCSRVA